MILTSYLENQKALYSKFPQRVVLQPDLILKGEKFQQRMNH